MGNIVTAGLGAFAACLVLQILAWRVLEVRREMLGLAVVYLALPVAAALAWTVLAPGRLLDIGLAGLLYLSLACAYIQTYPALREDIPTFRLLFALERAGMAGASESELLAAAGSAGLHAHKVADLAADGLVHVLPDGRLALRPAGRALATAFSAYRRLLGLERGHG